MTTETAEKKPRDPGDRTSSGVAVRSPEEVAFLTHGCALRELAKR